MLDQIVDQLFSYAMSKSFEMLEEVKNQYTNQKILLTTISHFAKSSFYLTEFKTTIFHMDEEVILTINSDKISPTLSPKDISNNILPIIEQCFLTDDLESLQQISRNVAIQYISKHKLFVTLSDIAIAQRKQTDEILDNLDEIQKDINKLTKSIQRESAKKERALRSGLDLKIHHFIIEVAKGFLLITTKHSPQDTCASGSNSELTQFMDDIKKQIDIQFPVVDSTFYQRPIEIIGINPSDPFHPTNIVIPAVQYLDIYRRTLNNCLEDLLKYITLLPDDCLICFMEFLKLLDQHPCYTVYIQHFSSLIETNPLREEDVLAEKRFYTTLGKKILEMQLYLFSD